jgi:hypothetical protein
MNRDSLRPAHALIASAFVCFLGPCAAALAQGDGAPPAASAPSAAAVEAAPQSRRDRRRASKAETPAAEAETQTADATASATSAADLDAAESAGEPERICKNIKPLGTRMAKRVCGTPEQWAAFEKKTTDAAADDMRQVRGANSVIATTPGPATGPP